MRIRDDVAFVFFCCAHQGNLCKNTFFVWLLKTWEINIMTLSCFISSKQSANIRKLGGGGMWLSHLLPVAAPQPPICSRRLSKQIWRDVGEGHPKSVPPLCKRHTLSSSCSVGSPLVIVRLCTQFYTRHASHFV